MSVDAAPPSAEELELRQAAARGQYYKELLLTRGWTEATLEKNFKRDLAKRAKAV